MLFYGDEYTLCMPLYEVALSGRLVSKQVGVHRVPLKHSLLLILSLMTNITLLLDITATRSSISFNWYFKITSFSPIVYYIYCLFRKSKVKALDIVEKDKTGRYVNLFINLGDIHGKVDFDVASDLVCCMYAQSKCRDVDEARYSKLMQMTGKIDQVIQTKYSTSSKPHQKQTF